MIDAQLGQNYTAWVPVTDADGSWVTAGVSGTMTVASETDGVTLDSGAITHLGQGRWGRAFVGANFTLPGTYRFNVASLVTPQGTFVNQGGSFVVGEIEPDRWTLRQVLELLVGGTLLGIGKRDRITAASDTTHLTLPRRFSGGAADDLKGAELILYTLPTPADYNPYLVTNKTTGGVITYTPATGAAATVGSDALVIRDETEDGWGYDDCLDALRAAYSEGDPTERAADSHTLVPVANTLEYATPADWAALTGVEVRQPSSPYTGDWRPLARGPAGYWHVERERRMVVFHAAIWPRWSIRLRGLRKLDFRPVMGAYVPVEPVWMAYRAAATLLAGSSDAGRARRAGLVAARAEALYETPRWPAGSEWLAA
jgi:hypothetical protein